jgi:hypothetical protein
MSWKCTRMLADIKHRKSQCCCHASFQVHENRPFGAQCLAPAFGPEKRVGKLMRKNNVRLAVGEGIFQRIDCTLDCFVPERFIFLHNPCYSSKSHGSRTYPVVHSLAVRSPTFRRYHWWNTLWAMPRVLSSMCRTSVYQHTPSMQRSMTCVCVLTVLGVYGWARVCAQSWASGSSRAMPWTGRIGERRVLRFHRRWA